MILQGPRDHYVLVALGATRVSDITDESGAVTGVEVEPGIDISGYDAAVAADASRRKAVDDLAASARVVLACFEAGVPFPADWRAYRKALREIAATGVVAGDWPATPPAPEV